MKPDKIAERLIDCGYAPIPHIKIDGEWTLRKFINKDTGEYGYPATHKDWLKPMPLVSFVLRNTLLVDIDGYKGGTLQDKKDAVCEVLGIDEFDLEMSLFQTNDEGDSLHYLFKLPKCTPFDTIAQSNDGKLIKHVDFKTGRQLAHIKPHKTVSWLKSDELVEIERDNLIKVLKENLVEADYDDFKSTEVTTPYGHGALRSIDQRATAFIEEGERNHELAKAVVSIYELVAGGEIAIADAEEAIASIVDQLGIGDESDTKTTIEFNKSKGMKQPKSAPKNEALESRIESLEEDDPHRERAKSAIKHANAIVKDLCEIELDADLDVVHLMIKGSFWQPKEQRLHTINDIDEKVIFGEKDAHTMLTEFYGNPVLNMDAINRVLDCEDCELLQSEKNKVRGAMMNSVMNVIKAYNQRIALEMGVDMFSEHTYFKFKPNCAVEKHKHIKLTPPRGVRYDAEAIAEYKKHFPQLDDVLALLVAARFASSRKKAYLWLKAESDWGKDFFRVALGDLAVEMSVKEVEKAIEGAPVGKSPTDFHRTMVMVTNEFKNVKSELKQLEDSIVLSAKYQLETRVPLYTKLFMSAESVDSLLGEYGVESQFANRFSLIECEGVINQLDAFKRLGGSGLMQVVQTYVAECMNVMIEEYRELGDIESQRVGDEAVVAFHSKYAIHNGRSTIEQNLGEVAEILKDYLIQTYENVCDNDGEYMYLTSAKTRVKDALFKGGVVDRSEAHTLAYKTKELCEKLSFDGRGVVTRRCADKTMKSVAIPITDMFA